MRRRARGAFSGLVLVCAALIVLAPAASFADDPTDEAMKAVSHQIHTFIPKGHSLSAYAASDFNSDGVKDLVVVLSDDEPATEPVTCLLLVLLGKAKGGYDVSARSKIDCTTTYGPHGSGFGGISARKNTFLVKMYENLSGAEYRYQLRGGRWFLIGTRGSDFTNANPPGLSDDPKYCFVQEMAEGDTCKEHTVDINLLTGESIETSTLESGHTATVKRRYPVAPLQPLGEWLGVYTPP